MSRKNSKHQGILAGLFVILLGAAFALSGCATQSGQSTHEAVGVAATGTAVATATVATTITPTVVLSTPTPTKAPAMATATAIALTPKPGWVWYEKSDAPGVLFQLPQTWNAGTFRQRRAQAPGTNSIVEVQAFEFSGSDWLAWVQHESQPGFSLADGFVKQNGLVQGHPAFLFLEEGGGSSTIELYIRDESQIVNFFFQSGIAPRAEEEMEVLLTMFETIQFASGDKGETSLPTGWIQGHILSYNPERLEFTGKLQTVTGAVEFSEISPTVYDATIIDADGTSYQVDLRWYYSFQALPISQRREDLQPGQSVTLTGYQTADGRFYPLWGQTVNANDETVVLYRPFFDLHRFDPAILGEYPASVSLNLRGAWEQVQPYLVDEPDSPLPTEILTLDPAQDVIVKGTLQSTAPPQLTIEEFYYLDGECEMMTSNEQQCKFYQPAELTQ